VFDLGNLIFNQNSVQFCSIKFQLNEPDTTET